MAEAREANFWPVRDPTPFELFFLCETQRVDEHTDAESWAKKLKQNHKAIIEFVESGAKSRMDVGKLRVDLKKVASGHYMDVMGKKACLMVDLDHDDKTLEFAFQVWLAGVRNSLREEAPQPVGEKEFAKWSKFALLPAFDLLFWSRVTNARYTDAFMAKAVWPGTLDAAEFVDITERFRKVTRPMVEEVFRWNFVARFWSQMELENSLDVLSSRHKAQKAKKASVD